MLKVYIYRPEDAEKAMGLEAFENTLIGHRRHENISHMPLPRGLEYTGKASSADWFWLPYDIGHWEARGGGVEAIRRGLPSLMYWKGNEARHFFFLHSDRPTPIGIPSVIFRQSVNKHDKDERTVAFPARADDLGYMACDSFDKLSMFTNFVGHVDARQCRRDACQALQGKPDVYLDLHKAHWGSYQYTELGQTRRESFLRGLQMSKTGLAPRGGGEHSFRFFEIMSAGRVPILISDTWERPFEELIDYDSCSFTVEEKTASCMDNYIEVLKALYTDQMLQEMGRKARKYWERYLAYDRWDEMIVRYLKEYM